MVPMRSIAAIIAPIISPASAPFERPLCEVGAELGVDDAVGCCVDVRAVEEGETAMVEDCSVDIGIVEKDEEAVEEMDEMLDSGNCKANADGTGVEDVDAVDETNGVEDGVDEKVEACAVDISVVVDTAVVGDGENASVAVGGNDSTKSTGDVGDVGDAGGAEDD
ncbi:hypothetical protein B7494_g3404 [Chlorociboria aeruginascens]|nr:hypothetical protein B7494_g3404 [Chlorociboria aeruginascens]